MLIRLIYHQKDSVAKNIRIIWCNKTYLSSCHGQIDWMRPKTLQKVKKLQEQEIRESLKLSNLKVKVGIDDLLKF